jgi:hypothetical protein
VADRDFCSLSDVPLAAVRRYHLSFFRRKPSSQLTSDNVAHLHDGTDDFETSSACRRVI